MSDNEREEGKLSRIRQEIIDNARTNAAIRDREQRIKSRREHEAETPAPPRKSQRSEVREDDGNIRVTIYIPRFLIKIILANWFIWFGAFPAVALLWSGEPALVVYVPLILLFALLGLFLMAVGWYLYWWIAGVYLTCGTVVLFAMLFVGAVEVSRIRELVEQVFR